MAADIEAIRREFTPGLRVHVPTLAELDRLEAVLGIAVVPQPNAKAAGMDRWTKRDPLKDQLRAGDPSIRNRQLGNIVVTVLAKPLSLLNTAIQDRSIKRTKTNGLEQPIRTETRSQIISELSKHCVGLSVDAEVLSLGNSPVGRLQTNVWYVPRLPEPNVRTMQERGKDRQMTAEELMLKSAPTRQMIPAAYSPYSRDYIRAMQADGAEFAYTVPSLELNEVLARTGSPTELSLKVGDVVTFPVYPAADQVETRWGDAHVVTGVSFGDAHAFTGARILSNGDPGILDRQAEHMLPVQLVNGVGWSIERIVDSMQRMDRGLDTQSMRGYLGFQAAAGEIMFSLPPLVA